MIAALNVHQFFSTWDELCLKKIYQNRNCVDKETVGHQGNHGINRDNFCPYSCQ